MAYDKGDSKSDKQQESEWAGKERRETPRRSGHDRREMIRFEMNKEDRRKGRDRRKDNRSAWDSGTTS